MRRVDAAGYLRRELVELFRPLVVPRAWAVRLGASCAGDAWKAAGVVAGRVEVRSGAFALVWNLLVPFDADEIACIGRKSNGNLLRLASQNSM